MKLDLCSTCQQPAHASETDELGRCETCRQRTHELVRQAREQARVPCTVWRLQRDTTVDADALADFQAAGGVIEPNGFRLFVESK